MYCEISTINSLHFVNEETEPAGKQLPKSREGLPPVGVLNLNLYCSSVCCCCSFNSFRRYEYLKDSIHITKELSRKKIYPLISSIEIYMHHHIRSSLRVSVRFSSSLISLFRILYFVDYLCVTTFFHIFVVCISSVYVLCYFYFEC